MVAEKKQVRVNHAYWVIKRFGLQISTRTEFDPFLVWMNAMSIASIHLDQDRKQDWVCATRQESTGAGLVKPPSTRGQKEVLTKHEIKKVSHVFRAK